MINHLRTLLVNMHYDPAAAISDPYEQYIDPGYAPQTSAHIIGNLVMPPGLPRHSRNIRVLSLLNMLQRPDMMKYVLKFDARLSYSLDDRNLINALVDGDERIRVDAAAFYAQLSSVINTGTNLSALFDCSDFHPDDFKSFRQMWMTGATPVDRVSAAMLAMVYRMERERTLARPSARPVVITGHRPQSSSSAPSSSTVPPPARDCSYMYGVDWVCAASSWNPVQYLGTGGCAHGCSDTGWNFAMEGGGLCRFQRTMCALGVCYNLRDCDYNVPPVPSPPSTPEPGCQCAMADCAFGYTAAWDCVNSSWGPVAYAGAQCDRNCSDSGWNYASHEGYTVHYARTLCVPEACYLPFTGRLFGAGGGNSCDPHRPVDPAAPSAAAESDCAAFMGACCHENGACARTTEADCYGGTWQGPSTYCYPNLCHQPSAQCCFIDGTCEYVNSADCLSLGGAWGGWPADCSSPCPQPTGACCHPDGTCAVTLLADCSDTWTMFGNCTPNTCHQPSAQCCFPDGICEFLTAADCANAGGTWGGWPTTCSPNLCAQPSAQCCFSNGSCRMLTSAVCAGSAGTWGGYGTTCTPNLCAQPSGACCTSGGTCSVLTSAACVAGGGTYWGDATVCSPNPCPQPLTLTGTNILNHETSLAGDVTAGATSIAVADASLFHIGDTVMIIQMQVYRYVADPAAPDMAAVNANLGKYELATISLVSGNTVYFGTGLSNSYKSDSGAYTLNNTRAQMVFVPAYSTLNFSGGAILTCNPWNGLQGGIVAVKANSIIGTGTIHANYIGYRATFNGSDAEGWMGNYGNPVPDSITYLQGSGNTAYNNAGHNSGGGGHKNNGQDNPCPGGLAFGNSNLLENLTFGGAGGGVYYYGPYYGWGGGSGGGIVCIIANNINSSIKIQSVGGQITGGSNCACGAGGSILIWKCTYSGTYSVAGGAGAGGPIASGSVGYYQNSP